MIGILWLIPAAGLFVTSLLPAAAANAEGWWHVFSKPSELTFANYRSIFNNNAITHALFVTAEVTIGATILPILIASLAAYALAWIEFPGRDWAFVTVVGLMVVPIQMALIPIFSLYNTLNLYDTVFGLILFHTAFALPFAIFLLRNFFAGIPRDLMEAARIDGASEWRLFFKVVLPLGLPAIAALAIFQVLFVWNDFLVGLHARAGQHADRARPGRPAAPVRLEPGRDRAGVVLLRGDPTHDLRAVPALLRAGAFGGVGQIVQLGRPVVSDGRPAKPDVLRRRRKRRLAAGSVK